jgi:hypothetical protein
MKRTQIANAAGLLASLALAAGVAGCRIHVDKDANGKEKNVQVDTPFGGVHVNTDQTTAADLGLPAYPGAQQVKDDDDHKSADVHMGFGEWELRVQAVSYETPDKKDQVVAYYKKALARYGDVLTCQDNAPVGTPTKTSEGLTCAENSKANVQVDTGNHRYGYNSEHSNFELKAGSERHQHIVGFETPMNGQTRFALVAIDLPSFATESSGKSN